MAKRSRYNFSITGIPPLYLDFTSEYPVLALRVEYLPAGDYRVRNETSKTSPRDLWSFDKLVYAKNTSFLIADKEARFKWVSQDESSYFGDAPAADQERHPDRSIRYSLIKEGGEKKNMIYPVRAFSITGITMDGFDPGKAYPVLAIDMDQYIPENTEAEEEKEEEEDIQPVQASQSLAFFLVGDDNGEFTWVAEDECRLYPLESG